MSYIQEVYRWDQVGPNEQVEIWISGYGDNEAVCYSIVPGKPPGVWNPHYEIKAQLTDDTTGRWRDGSVQRHLLVQNQSKLGGPSKRISVRLIEFGETF
jgi:hypothetical protein